MLGWGRERRLDQEIADHLDLLTDQYIAAGMVPAEARRAARRAFGGIDQMKEAYRDQRRLTLVDALGQDVRFAIRLLARNRGFAVTAILVLAVGIGINNMLFTILNAHTLRGLPIPHSDRVLWVSTIDDRGSARGLSVPGYRDLAAAARPHGAHRNGAPGRGPPRRRALRRTHRVRPRRRRAGSARS